MKKRIVALSVLALIMLIASMPLSVNAHSGRTDSKGGHKNHSTGEYHYHHGYSAHDHYDMDGDGDVDCPYDFKDKTSNSSGNSSKVSPNIVDTPKSDTQKSNTKPSKTSLADIAFTIFEVLLPGIGIWFFASYFLSYIFFFLFGDEQGCSISMIVGAVIAIVVCIWLVKIQLS